MPDANDTMAMGTIYVDADACPVKEEIYRVASRVGWVVVLVANKWMQTPTRPVVQLNVVDDSPDAADDFIAERAKAGDVVVTNDIPLASRCLPNGVAVLRPNGSRFEEQSVGDALATRELLSQLRDLGTITGGPPPFQKKDRSRFLQRLDETIRAIQRSAAKG